MSRPASLGSTAEAERQAGSGGYSTSDVATLLGLSPAQIRSYVRAGSLAPEQGPRGEHRFSFQDLILLRTAKGLLAARVPHRRIVLALKNLREQLPADRPLTGVRIAAHGHHVVVRDGGEVWNPESGQALLDFEVAELARDAASLVRRDEQDDAETAAAGTAEAWFEEGLELEIDDPAAAIEAYREALEIDPSMADAHLNLGRLLHEAGRTAEAEAHYRRCLEMRPDDATALFNLGVALQDLGRTNESAEAYERALELDPALADAHFNLAGVYEGLGQKKSAIRHLKSYKSLIGR